MIVRREFITLLGGAAAWPLAAGAQQGDRIRRIGLLMNVTADHPDATPRLAAFRDTLRELGWVEGRNVSIEVRWGGADFGLYRRYAAELVALAPDVLVTASGLIAVELQRVTRSVPIVAAVMNDPLTLGYIDSLAKPGGNMTGFARIEYSFSAKWLELLKEIAPNVERAAILRDTNRNGDHQFTEIKAAAPSLKVNEVNSIGMVDADQIERDVAEFASRLNGGLVLTAGTLSTNYSHLIIALAAKHRLPAVYPNSSHVARGGLVSYGPSVTNEYKRAAGYVDRILHGDKPADLPVQRAVLYETVLNLKTAAALGLKVPSIIMLRADEVIE